jgi:DNA-directed RNA polymerase subunit RPC12/RpoP
MGAKAVECRHCGAGMLPAADGRTYDCRYCGARILVSVEAEQIAAGLKLDLSNGAAFLQRLAEAMEWAFAERTKVHRSGAEVTMIEIDLGADAFVVRKEARGVVAQHKKVVRGIALKTATHPLDRWASMLHTALAAHANESTRATAALQSLFGKG